MVACRLRSPIAPSSWLRLVVPRLSISAVVQVPNVCVQFGQTLTECFVFIEIKNIDTSRPELNMLKRHVLQLTSRNTTRHLRRFTPIGHTNGSLSVLQAPSCSHTGKGAVFRRAPLLLELLPGRFGSQQPRLEQAAMKCAPIASSHTSPEHVGAHSSTHKQTPTLNTKTSTNTATPTTHQFTPLHRTTSNHTHRTSPLHLLLSLHMLVPLHLPLHLTSHISHFASHSLHVIYRSTSCMISASCSITSSSSSCT